MDDDCVCGSGCGKCDVCNLPHCECNCNSRVDDIKDEIFDMARPNDSDKITLQDAKLPFQGTPRSDFIMVFVVV